MSWFDELPDPVPLVKAEPAKLVPKADSIRDIELEIQEEAVEVLRGALAFADIEPEATEPPFEWVKELGQAKAWKLFKLAKYGQMNAKEAPIALRMAKDLMLGIMRSKSKEKTGPKTLNMVVVQMTADLPKFGELEVDK